jgi:hypothetical protein
MSYRLDSADTLVVLSALNEFRERRRAIYNHMVATNGNRVEQLNLQSEITRTDRAISKLIGKYVEGAYDVRIDTINEELAREMEHSR